MSTEVTVILCGVGIVALLWLALRFGRQIVRVLLVGGILIVGIIASLALLNQVVVSKEVAQAAHVASIGQSVTSVIFALATGGLGMLALCAMGAAGVFWLKWKLVERQKQLPRRKQRKALPHQEPEILYIVEDDVDLTGVDLSLWGW